MNGRFPKTAPRQSQLASGLVRPSLYGAFGSKAEMYLMSMDAFFEKLTTARSSLASSQTAEEALGTFYLHMIDLYVGADKSGQIGCFLVGTAQTEAPSDTRLREALAERLSRLTQMLAAALQAKVPGADPDDIQFAAEQAAATLHSMAVRARAGESRDRLVAFALRSARFITRSLFSD